MGNEGGLQAQTDKHFIQQQVQLLATAFTVQDCPGLTGDAPERSRARKLSQYTINMHC